MWEFVIYFSCYGVFFWFIDIPDCWMIIFLDEKRQWHYWEKLLSTAVSLESSKMIPEQAKSLPSYSIFSPFFASSQDPKFHHFITANLHPAFPSPLGSFWCVSIRYKFSRFLTSFNIDSYNTKAGGCLWRDSNVCRQLNTARFAFKNTRFWIIKDCLKPIELKIFKQ